MDNLEKFLQNNRDAFDDQMPSPELWSKISAVTTRRKQIKIIPLLSKIAALIIIVIGTSIGIKSLITNNKGENSRTGVSTEVYEATLYYESIISQKKEKIFQLTSNQPELQSGINEDMALLDSALYDIKNDLKDQVANQEVIEALIQNYRMRLQILEDILSYVDKNDSQNSQNIETHEL